MNVQATVPYSKDEAYSVEMLKTSIPKPGVPGGAAGAPMIFLDCFSDK